MFRFTSMKNHMAKQIFRLQVQKANETVHTNSWMAKNLFDPPGGYHSEVGNLTIHFLRFLGR